MLIKNINVRCDGYVSCKSGFYSCFDVLPSSEVSFSARINRLVGEIDSQIWSVSYLLSMYKHRPKDFSLFAPPEIKVNNVGVSLDEFSDYTCYMDETVYPLFKSKASVRRLVSLGIKKYNLNCTPEEVRNLFHIDEERFERPIKGVGNERFRAMAAIGYTHGKQVFCFPWLSKMRFDGYHGHMTDLLEVLERLNLVVILPVGQ